MQPPLAALEAAVATETKGKTQCRTRGPYQDRNRWRLTFIEPGKPSRSEIFDTRAAALAAQRAFERRHAARAEFTVENLITRYIEFQVRKGSKPVSVEGMNNRSRIFFEYTGLLAHPAASLTPETAKAAYDAYTRRPRINPARGGRSRALGSGSTIAAATHQEDLNIVRCMYTWAVEEQLVPSNPFVAVRPIGRKNRGKQQLSLDNATVFLDAATQLAEQHMDAVALAVCVIVGSGARSCEVMKRRVRDLDEGGRKLHVQQGKNDNANRPLLIASRYVPLVQALAAGRPRDALLFAPDSDDGRRLTDHALRTRVLRKIKGICRLCNIDVVVTHSFRGLWATIGVSETGDPDLVARKLGHGSAKMTAQNYIDHRVAGVAQQERVQARLGLEPPLLSGPVSRRELTGYLDRLAEQLDVRQLQEMVAHLVSLITAKATTPALPVGSKAIPKRLPGRSRSNTEQVCGSFRNLSARPQS